MAEPPGVRRAAGAERGLAAPSGVAFRDEFSATVVVLLPERLPAGNRETRVLADGGRIALIVSVSAWRGLAGAL